jgi:hypothetical protein
MQQKPAPSPESLPAGEIPYVIGYPLQSFDCISSANSCVTRRAYETGHEDDPVTIFRMDD